MVNQDQLPPVPNQLNRMNDEELNDEERNASTITNAPTESSEGNETNDETNEI